MTTTRDVPSGDAPALLRAALPLVRSRPDHALRLSLTAARAARVLGSRGDVAQARRVAGEALLFLSRPVAAARLLRRVARWQSARGEVTSVREPLVRVAQALLHADRLVDAAGVLSDVERATPDDDASVVARRLHLTWAALEFRRERPRDALRHYRRIGRMPASRDRAGAIANMNAANSLAAAGRPGAATRRFGLARDGFVATGSPELCSFVDQNEAYARLRDGDLGEALTLFDRALDAAEQARDLALFPALCLDRAELFLLLAMPAEARREVDRLRARVPRLTPLDESHAAFVAAFATLLRGAHLQAADAFGDVAGEYAQTGLRERAAHCHILEARALLESGHVDAAEDLVSRARRALTGRRDPRRISADLLAADVACHRGDVLGARARLAAAWRGSGESLAPWTHVEIARTEAEIARVAGDTSGRRAALNRAADALDAQIGRLPVDEYLIPFLGAQSWLYEALAADRLAAGDPEAALQAVERGRARALLELLGAPTRLQASLGERRLARRRRELGIAHLRLHEAATRADGVNPEQLSTRRQQVAQTLSRAALPRASDPAPWSGIRAKLPTGTTLLEYAWIGERLHAFVVHRGGVRHTVLEADRTAIRRIVERLAFRFRTARAVAGKGPLDSSSQHALETHLARIRAAVWTPLADSIPAGRLVLVPAEHLHLVPFHAVTAGDTESEARWTVSYAPSATTFVTPPPSPRATGGRCAVFALADTNAPEIDDEAQAVAATWPETEVLSGSAAHVQAFRDRVADARIVHVATHGVFEQSAPLFSSLRLADGWVNAYDVYGMRIGADLVILAACEMARSVASRDADLLGLVRAFLVAGAGNVLAPQWPVSDAAAKTYVVACFRALRDGAATAEAARRAAHVTREHHPNPADWAGWFPFCRVSGPA